MVNTLDNLIQLSALQHFIFCLRQCALIHIEQVWAENVFTAGVPVPEETLFCGKTSGRQAVVVDSGLMNIRH